MGISDDLAILCVVNGELYAQYMYAAQCCQSIFILHLLSVNFTLFFITKTHRWVGDELSQSTGQSQNLKAFARIVQCLSKTVAHIKGAILAVGGHLQKPLRVWSAHHSAVGDLNLLQALVGTSDKAAKLLIEGKKYQPTKTVSALKGNRK